MTNNLPETVPNLCREADFFTLLDVTTRAGLPILECLGTIKEEIPFYTDFLDPATEQLRGEAHHEGIEEVLASQIEGCPHLFTTIAPSWFREAEKYSRIERMLNEPDKPEDEHTRFEEGGGIKNGIEYKILDPPESEVRRDCAEALCEDVGYGKEYRVPKGVSVYSMTDALKDIRDILISRAGISPKTSPESEFYVFLSQELESRKDPNFDYTSSDISEASRVASEKSNFLSSDNLNSLCASITDNDSKLYEAMSSQPNNFPRYCVGVVMAGEIGEMPDLVSGLLGRAIELRNALKIE